MTYILPFTNLNKTSLSAAGGKGANLGEMTAAGFPVPPGFVLTTAAYDAFVSAHGLRQQILDLAASASTDDPQVGEHTSEAITAPFLTASIPTAIAEALLAAAAQLGETAVAVRSSATAEDLLDASFAGQQETLLNVQGEGALLDAVRRCWASLWTARATAYRQRHDVPHETVAMAVVVQQMVDAEVAGILFTANPATGARDEVLIEASYGLGQAIVSGEVTPDTVVLERTGLSVKETRVGTKDVMIVRSERGADGTSITTHSVPAERRAEAALSESLVSELAALGVAVEQRFGGVPQDIEWAVAGGHIWLLQARPITNLPPAPLRDVRWEPPVPGTVWMRRQVVEHMPEPLSPLFEELYLEEGLTRSVETWGAVMGVPDIDALVRDFMPHGFARTVNGYAYSAGSVDVTWRLPGDVVRVYAAILPRLLREGHDYWRDAGVATYRHRIERWQAIEPGTASDETLLEGVRELAVADAVYWFAAAIPLALARVTDSLLDAFLKRVADGDSPVAPSSAPYLRGFPTTAMEAQAMLEEIAAHIRRSTALHTLVLSTPPKQLLDHLALHPDAQPVLDGLHAYFDVYGHQIYNLDFATPTQASNPLPVLLSLRTAVAHPERDARAQRQELARAREHLVMETQRALNPLLRPVFRLLLTWAQQSTPFRDQALFHVGAAWPTLRRLALALGGRLAEIGSLHAADDVFFLHSAELAAASSARANGVGRPGLAHLAHERRVLRDARKRLSPPVAVPPDATLQIGPVRLRLFEPRPDVADPNSLALSGFAISPGRVTAAASVIRSPAEFDQMQPDTILVCPTTTPAWTPLFSQATGLVTDIGGALAHGSIVAREYNIPAVMGTGDATRRIQRGQRIRIDGDSGTVTLLGEADTDPVAPSTAPSTAASPGKTQALLALAAGAVVGLTASRWIERLVRR